MFEDKLIMRWFMEKDIQAIRPNGPFKCFLGMSQDRDCLVCGHGQTMDDAEQDARMQLIGLYRQIGEYLVPGTFPKE